MDKSRFRWFTVVSKRQVKVSVVRGNEEALQAKLDRGQEEFNGTWHSQVIDEEQAELLQWMRLSLYTERGLGTSHKIGVMGRVRDENKGSVSKETANGATHESEGTE
jgi:hypothetical protein